jgi:hypothetical protein
MIILLIYIASVWGCFWWRLRGGAFTAWTGYDPGTGGMRAIAAVGMIAPLVFINWHCVYLIPAMWIGWSLAGWGVFQGMGRSLNERPNIMGIFLNKIGVKNQPIHDLVGMAIEGVYCLIPVAIVIFLITHSLFMAIVVLLSGLMFSPLYFIGQRASWVPSIGWFEHPWARNEICECLVGAWVMPILFLTVNNIR